MSSSAPDRRSRATGPDPDDGSVRGRRADRIADLLEAVRDGRREALDELVDDLTPMLWQVARAQGLDRTAAEDVVQTTWLTLLRHLDGIRAPGALIGWLVTVTKRESWRVATAAGRAQPMPEDYLDRPDPGPPVDTPLELAEQGRMLWEAVGRLSRRCQELLRVVAFSPRPDYARVAAALDMKKGSIGPTRGRCLEKLHAELAADPHWSGP